jgi:hypothetical protein
MKRPDKTWAITIGVMCAVVVIGTLFTCNAEANGRGHHNERQETSRNNNLNANLNSNQNTSGSSVDSRTNVIAGSASNSGGNDLRSSSSGGDVGISITDAADSTTATGGVGQGGESASTDNSVTTTNTDNSTDYDYAASSAASVFAGYCQSGASAQISGGGFSVVNTDAFCEMIRLKDEMWEDAQREKCSVPICEGICTDKIATVELRCGEGSNYALYMERYHWASNESFLLIERTKEVALFDRFVGYLMKGLAIVGGAIILL